MGKYVYGLSTVYMQIVRQLWLSMILLHNSHHIIPHCIIVTLSHVMLKLSLNNNKMIHTITCFHKLSILTLDSVVQMALPKGGKKAMNQFYNSHD